MAKIILEWVAPLTVLAAVVGAGVWVSLLFAPWSIFILMGALVASVATEEVLRNIRIKKLHEFLRLNNGTITGFIVNEYLWASAGNGISFRDKPDAEAELLKREVISMARRIVRA